MACKSSRMVRSCAPDGLGERSFASSGPIAMSVAFAKAWNSQSTQAPGLAAAGCSRY